MSGPRPIKDLLGWFIHRLTANYWSLALGAVLLAPIVFATSLYLDRNGAAQWLLERGLAPVSNADTARDTAAVIAAIDAAFLTLYFSISLIVLTIAAGNLGVRLIDRWLGKGLVRVSIAGLCFTLIHAVLTMSAIDPEAQLSDTPLLTFAFSILLLAVNTVMLAVATHDLGRSMFIDRAIAALARDGRKHLVQVDAVSAFPDDLANAVAAPRSGYVEGIELDRIADALRECGPARLAVAPGQHVLKGEPLILSQRKFPDEKDVTRAIPIGSFRSDSQGAVFQIRLLVEIAARALSPAVNDFYTALAAVDAVVEIASGHCSNWVDEGQVPVSSKHGQIALPGQDFRGMFDAPLAALRQAAAPYPSVSIRLLDNLGRFIRNYCTESAGLAAYVRAYGEQVHRQARAQCEIDYDREALDRALADLTHRSGKA